MRPEGAVPVSAHDVARELRRRLPGAGVTVVHKLLYYCQGWHLAHTGRQLFSERIEAWINGPVVAAVWRAEERSEPVPEPHSLLPDALQTVGYVVSRYGKMTPQQLIDLTHEEPPWRDIARSEKAGRDEPIPLEKIKAFFDTEADTTKTLASVAARDPTIIRLMAESAERMHQGPGSVDAPEAIRARLEALG